MLAVAAGVAAQGRPSPRELIEAGHYKRARAIVESHPANDAETLYLMATLKQIWGDLDAAEKYAERAVAANPKDAQYHYRLADIVGEKAERASVFHQIGLIRTFKKECDLALSVNPNHIEALFDMMQYYLHAPGLAGGDKAKAHATAEQLMKLDPMKGYQAQIEIASAEKQTARVREIVNQALTMRAETYEAHMMLGNYLVGSNYKKYDEAERHAREAIRIHSDRAGAQSLLAATLVRQDKWPELDAGLAQAEKENPDNLFPYFRAGNNLLDRKVDLVRAERYFRRYLTQEPEPQMPSLAAAHWRLSLVLEQEGRKPESAAEYQTAVKLDPSLKKK